MERFGFKKRTLSRKFIQISGDRVESSVVDSKVLSRLRVAALRVSLVFRKLEQIKAVVIF